MTFRQHRDGCGLEERGAQSRHLLKRMDLMGPWEHQSCSSHKDYDERQGPFTSYGYCSRASRIFIEKLKKHLLQQTKHAKRTWLTFPWPSFTTRSQAAAPRRNQSLYDFHWMKALVLLSTLAVRLETMWLPASSGEAKHGSERGASEMLPARNSMDCTSCLTSLPRHWTLSHTSLSRSSDLSHLL